MSEEKSGRDEPAEGQKGGGNRFLAFVRRKMPAASASTTRDHAADKPLSESLLNASPFLIKVLELVLAVLCLILIYVPFDNRLQQNVHHGGIIYSAYISAIIINSVLITNHLQGQRVPQKLLYTYSVILGLLFFIAGYVVLHDWWALMHSLYFHPPKLFMDMMISSGAFAIINSIAFFVDVWLTYRYG